MRKLEQASSYLGRLQAEEAKENIGETNINDKIRMVKIYLNFLISTHRVLFLFGKNITKKCIKNHWLESFIYAILRV